MKYKIVIVFLILQMTTPFAQAHYCGKIHGKPIHTYGGLSCKKAKKIFKAFYKGHIPKGWTCGQSVGGCGKGKKGFYFK